MRTRSVGKLVMYGTLAVVLAGLGCKHPAPAPPAAPPPPPPAPAAPTASLQAMPTTIQRGQSSTLTWSSTNANSLSIAPNVGTVQPQGSMTVTPNNTTTYTVTATGPGGSTNASATVTVNVPPPPPPAAPQPSISELFAQQVKDAYFDFDKADIRVDARQALAATAAFLRQYPQVKVVIEGHCDERGSTEYNIALGDRRAQAAKDYLTSQGIGADRMQTVSYGKERPFCTMQNEECWQQNRRAHIALAQ